MSDQALSAQILSSLTALQARDPLLPEAGANLESQAEVTRHHTPPSPFFSGHGIASLLTAAHPVVAGARTVPQQDLHQQPDVRNLGPCLRETEGPGRGHPGSDAGEDWHWGGPPCPLPLPGAQLRTHHSSLFTSQALTLEKVSFL